MTRMSADSPNRMARSAFEASLPRGAYVDEAFLDLERERIWWSEWIAVGREEQLPNAGDFLAVDIAGERVIVVRDRAGGLHAHYDLCRHRGSRLTTADQRLDPESGDEPGPSGTFKGIIRCAYHSWCYELDGSVRNAPFLGEADRFDPDLFGLHPAALATWGGWRPRARGPAGRSRHGSAATRSRICGPREGSSMTSAPTGRSSSRTTTSATTARASTPSCAGSCRRSGRRAARTSTGTEASPR